MPFSRVFLPPPTHLFPLRWVFLIHIVLQKKKRNEVNPTGRFTATSFLFQRSCHFIFQTTRINRFLGPLRRGIDSLYVTLPLDRFKTEHNNGLYLLKMSYIQVIYFFRSEINRMSSEVFVQKQVKQIQFKLSDFEFGS